MEKARNDWQELTMSNDPQGQSWPAQTHGLNFYTRDKNLQRFLQRSAPAMLERREQALEDFGAFCGGELDDQAAYSDRIHPPVLKHEVTDPIHPDERKGHVYLNPRYEAAQQEMYRRGFLAGCFDQTVPEPHILPFVAQYMVCQSDIATGCPFAMTHPVALLIDRQARPTVKARFLPEILRTDGHTPVGGTWATEKHSGSDIGSTKTRAVDQGDGTVRLHGENWFTSAIGFARFLTIKTARPDGAAAGSKGLGLYLVPSHIDPDWIITNDYDVVHLKEKVGTRGLPTGEVKLTGTTAYELAPAGAGLKMMMEALSCSRVHNAMAAAGTMRRALMESLCWASHRAPFGKLLAEQPMVQNRILDIQTEWLAGSALAFEAARGFDATQTSARTPDTRKPWARIATALAKYKTAEQAVWCTRRALELVGGNGYTEEYPVARQFRDAQVTTVWEGPEQIQALELMRMLIQEKSGEAYLERLSAIHAALPDAMKTESDRLLTLSGEMSAALHTLAQNPAAAPQVADEYLHRMADVLAYALLCEEGAWEIAHCNDAEKALFAVRFYERTFVHNLRPGLDIPLLQIEFARVVSGQGFAPSL
jgi:acyl-CoA dehydrogenase